MSTTTMNLNDLKPDTILFESTLFSQSTTQGTTAATTVPKIPVHLLDAFTGYIDLLSTANAEKLEALNAALMDGFALGMTELSVPDAKDLPDLIGDLTEGLGKDETSSVAFDLGRALAQELDASHGGGGVTSPDGADHGVPDPGDLGSDTTVSAMDVFSAVRDPLNLTPESDIDHPNLQTGHAWTSTITPAPPEEESPPAEQEPVNVLYTGYDVHGEAVKTGVAIVAALQGIAAAAGATTIGLAASGAAVPFLIATGVHAALAADRPTGDTPTAEEADISLEETLEIMAQKIGGLVLKFSEEAGVKPPEDMPAFELSLRKALWDSVARPSGTEDDGSGDGDTGIDPEDLQHELEPSTDQGIPLPDGANPDEPFDPTTGAGSVIDDAFMF